MNENSESDAEVPLSVSERRELDQLRREKREWVVEREILKKATAFWVKESNA
jgi:transposase-like protein